MKRMKREIYVAPSTVRRSVRVESGFAASVVKDDKVTVKTTGHELNEVDVTDQPWNDATWE